MAQQKLAGFTPQGARRLIRATEAVERAYRLPALPGGQFTGSGSGIVPAVTAGAISAKSGSTAGSGDVTLYDMGEDGGLTSTGITLKCWNMGGAIASGKDVLVGFGTRGPWLVVVPCS